MRPGDTIQPSGIVKSKQVTANSRWVLIDVLVRNQEDEKVATGEAMVEFPLSLDLPSNFHRGPGPGRNLGDHGPAGQKRPGNGRFGLTFDRAMA